MNEDSHLQLLKTVNIVMDTIDMLIQKISLLEDRIKSLEACTSGHRILGTTGATNDYDTYQHRRGLS